MRAVENGATVLTASRRLARVFTQQFNSRQREQGRSVWRTPDILPLNEYLRRGWREWIVLGRRAEAPLTLLSAVQEESVWEQIIRESPQGESLLRIPETARAAMEAWRLVHSYRLPVDGQLQANEDSSAFLGWAKGFQKRCKENGWLEEARLSDFVAQLLRRSELAKPSKLLLAGFDDRTPQDMDLLDAFGEFEEYPGQRFESIPQYRQARDSDEEIRLAAGWARELLNRNRDSKIGVVVAGLSMLRSKAERIFREELHPGPAFEAGERAFHLSIGRPLSEYPMIHTALLLLEFVQGAIPLPHAGTLFRSPFLGGAEKERSARAALDARLRRRSAWNVSPSTLLDHAGTCPELQRLARAAQAEIENLASVQRPGEWSRSFSKILRAFGWPGERSLNSLEYQTVEAWQSVLSTFAALDATATPLSFANALETLREVTGETVFQAENEGAPVQIMGLLESSGLSFDHLWVTGLHDEALPAAARPNPFLPLRMQREHGLPHSSADRELEFASKILGRLLASAPDVVLSYPMQEGERQLGPTPLVDWADSSPRSPERQRGDLAWELDSLTDEIGPSIPALSDQKGGASLFRDMAACPFRAFAQHRLNARPLDDPSLGLDARDKGMLVHKALELIWTELQTQERLRSLLPAALADLVSRNVKAALDQQRGGLGRSLEQIRLEHVLTEWLEIEKSRTSFVVLPPEQKRVVNIGGLAVNLRIDRVDELPDGRQIILDYKTGEVKSMVWTGERPAEPQVPLYCATSASPIAGAALVQIHAGDLSFRGLDDSGSLPDLKRMQTDSGTLTAQIAEWKRVLTALGERFRAGSAEASPLDGACEYCGITTLCRIRELTNE